jgi:hypothetical protein
MRSRGKFHRLLTAAADRVWWRPRQGVDTIQRRIRDRQLDCACAAPKPPEEHRGAGAGRALRASRIGAGRDEKPSRWPKPLIVAESEGLLQELTVGEAVMQLDLTDKAFLLFRNAAHGRLSVVHRRTDGHVGWIDPHAETPARDSASQARGGARKFNGSDGGR